MPDKSSLSDRRREALRYQYHAGMRGNETAPLAVGLAVGAVASALVVLFALAFAL